MLAGWFDTKGLDAFADALIAELVERFPPSGAHVSGDKAFDKLRRTFGVTFDKIDAYARAHQLNVFKKAHLANRVRWALKEAGYAPDFVSTMTQELVAHVTLASRNKKNT